jgi:signal transduction histidine kinase
LKRNKPRLGIKWSLFLSFVIFSGVMLLLLWLFQIVFLDSFYRSIKAARIKSTAETLVRNIDSENIDSLVDQLAQTQEISIQIINPVTSALIASNADVPGWNINPLPGAEVRRFYDQAKGNGGTFFEQAPASFFGNQTEGDPFSGHDPRNGRNGRELMTYAQIAAMKDGTEVIIMLNAMLSPVSSTVETLRTQLLFVTAIMIGLSLILALMLSRRVSRPIVRINHISKELAKGNYQVTFESSGYKEVAELADTLNIAAHELNKVEQLRRELIANVSHDLRTPLTMISGYAEVMRDLPGENNPENVQVIIDEARRLAGLVNDMLDLSKLQSGSQKLNLADYNLTRSIRALLGRYNRLVEQEGFQIIFEAEHDLAVTADELRIEQVLYNLINNAVNYTGEDKKVIVRQTEEDGFARIEIIDSGEGIPADQLPHIWDRYYQVDKTHRRAVIGTGLGLSIVKGALVLHQAPFGVDSSPDKGSVFWFKLRKAGSFTDSSHTGLQPAQG